MHGGKEKTRMWFYYSGYLAPQIQLTLAKLKTPQETCYSLGGIAWRFTRMILRMRGCNYESLEKMDLLSLQQRRLRGDLIEVYKIMRFTNRINREKLLPLVGKAVTRGYGYKIVRCRLKEELSIFLCAQWVGIRNDLTSRMVEESMCISREK